MNNLPTYTYWFGKMDSICGLHVKYFDTIELYPFEYDVYKIDKSKYDKPYVIIQYEFNNRLVDIANHRILFTPKYGARPSTYSLYKIGYGVNVSRVFYNDKEEQEFEHLYYDNNIENIERLGAYKRIPPYTRITYMIHDLSNPLNEKYHIGLVNKHLHVSYVQPNQNGYPYFIHNTIVATNIPMLKHGYIDIFVYAIISSEHIGYVISSDIISKPEYVKVYDTTIYKPITYEQSLKSLSDTITFLSKHMDHRKWIGFENVKFVFK